MKPNFALNLSHDGLSLLRRATGGWQVFGSVELDDPKLPEKLGYLRKTATELAGGQLAAKLVIPNSEILYRTVTATGDSDAERESAVREALVGATPYAVNELAYDWADAGGGKTHIAAVARDTLDEAESFATEHRFNPVSFVAIPDDGSFVGEPFFGETGISRSILPENETVEGDPGPIVIVGDHDPQTATDAIEQNSTDIAAGPPGPNATDPQNSQDPAKNRAEPEKTTAKKFSRVDVKITQMPDDLDEEPEGVFATVRDGETTAKISANGLEDVTPRFALYANKSNPDFDEDTIDAALPSTAIITPKAVTDPDVADDEPPKKTAGKLTPKKSAKIKSVQQKPAPLVAPSKNQQEPASQEKLGKSKTVFDIQHAQNHGARSGPTGIAMLFGAVAAVLLGVLVSSFYFDRPIAVSRLWQGFGDTGKPIVAESLSQPQIVSTPIEPLSQVSTAETTPVDPSATPEPDVELAALDPEAHLAGPTPLTENQNSPPLGEITPEEALVIQASTGMWVLAPIPPVELIPEELDEFYVASIDHKIISLDAVALPETSGALDDTRIGEVASPAPAGTRFDLDERGFVRATAAGAISADGVRITLGAPAVTPILRPVDAAGFEAPIQVASETPEKIRPVRRPSGLIQTDERARLGGLTRVEMARIRPLARPASPQDSPTALDQTPTEYAVLVSPQPATRPVNFASTVEIARATAQAQAVAAAVASANATVAAPTVPSIPTSASVAREATIGNAINLSNVNLIGVYGSTSDRRALVRLKSGRYVKVQIGDRLDGGKVAAIQGTQLQYIKAGRMVTLDIAS